MFFTNAENALLAKLANDNDEIRNKAVLQVLSIKETQSKKIPAENSSNPHSVLTTSRLAAAFFKVSRQLSQIDQKTLLNGSLEHIARDIRFFD